jgi:hypothetical protein
MFAGDEPGEHSGERSGEVCQSHSARAAGKAGHAKPGHEASRNAATYDQTQYQTEEKTA